MKTQIPIRLASLSKAHADLVVCSLFEGEKVPPGLSAELSRLLASAGEKAGCGPGHAGSVLHVSTSNDFAAAVVGLGPKAGFEVLSLNAWAKESSAFEKWSIPIKTYSLDVSFSMVVFRI